MFTCEDFEARLLAASTQATDFARRFVRDRLPERFRYHLLLNMSHDSNRHSDELVYPEDKDVEVWLVDQRRVVDLLWRNGTCPVWIDVSATAVSAEWTVLRLWCAGRYSGNPERLYYPARETRPFAVKGPDFPTWWAMRESRQWPTREIIGSTEFDDRAKWRLPRVPAAPMCWLLQRSGLLQTYMGWAGRRMRHQRPRRPRGPIGQ